MQAAEVMLYTVDRVNSSPDGTVLPPGVRMGAYILDDCDKDTYGLQQAVEFIKGDDDDAWHDRWHGMVQAECRENTKPPGLTRGESSS